MPLTSDSLTEALQTLENLAKGKRTVWGSPVPWIAEPVFASGFATLLAYGSGNQVITTTYEVPRGYTALICGLVFGYAGTGGSSSLPGQLLYTVDSLNSSAVLVSPEAGYNVKDYGLVPFQLGSLVPGDPWPVEFKFDQNETVRIKAYAVAGVAVGAGNFAYGALVGWQWPTMGWEG